MSDLFRIPIEPLVDPSRLVSRGGSHVDTGAPSPGVLPMEPNEQIVGVEQGAYQGRRVVVITTDEPRELLMEFTPGGLRYCGERPIREAEECHGFIIGIPDTDAAADPRS